ncbi:hypothetical protein JTY93_13900 [Pseudomonas hygromyciniae]|uniref:Dermonecrotic toxin N-terminal domain-containing protein n=1 Tax=Pseudomonas hygromyciniae TaxID=2812000 RepID=A0ABX7JQV7_9PSED|nr:DUF6543 domain-containing protein [Pseudomonas hygromyciniae]QSB37485.1 hypothetical protein JTY93_13900 [Pseudomonas hygromyciniae]
MTDSPALPPTPSIHGRLLKTRTPQWLIDATSQRREALKLSDAFVPPAYRLATSEQRQQVRDCVVASFTAQTALDKTMSALQDIETFARPLLVNALQDQFGVTLAPRIETWLSLRKSLQVTHLNLDTLTYDFLKLELLQAALHNFEEAECEQGAFHTSSGFKWQVPTRGVSPQNSLVSLRMRGLEVHQFIKMCRTLDIGGQYQRHITEFFYPRDTVAQTTLREQFIAGQKTAMRAAAELALLGKDITRDDYNMLLSVIDGERSPRIGGQPVWICDLGLMKLRMTGCVLFLAFDDADVHSPILYIPPRSLYPPQALCLARPNARDPQAAPGYAGLGINPRKPPDGLPALLQSVCRRCRSPSLFQRVHPGCRRCHVAREDRLQLRRPGADV